MVMLDSEEIRQEEAGRLIRNLDEMGFGEWSGVNTGGGCHVLECVLSDGRVVFVSGDDVLSWVCDPSDFGGSVTVGVYADHDAIYNGDEAEVFVSVPLAVGDRTADGIAIAVHGVLSGSVAS